MIAAPQLRSNASTHLDAVRGAAALVVFLGHGRPLFLSSRLVAQGSAQLGEAGTPRTTLGHEAVIVFFVLSGYFVGGSVLRNMRRGSFSWGPYLLQRLSRLWVVLLPALLLGLAVDHWGIHLWGAVPGSLYTAPAGSIVFPGLAARLSMLSLLGNAIFLQQSGIEPFGTNVALWSLACEFWYYLFFPLLLSTLQPSLSVRRRLLSGLSFLLFLVACGKGVAMYFPLWLAGCGVALLPARIPAKAQRFAVGILSGLLLITLMCGLRLPLPRPVADVAIALVFAGLLWAILHNQRTNLNRVYGFLAKSLAKVSYTLYTVHVPLLVFGCALVSPVWHPQRFSSHLVAELSAVYLGTLLITVTMYALFERNTEVVRARIGSILVGAKVVAPSSNMSGADALRPNAFGRAQALFHKG